MLQIQQTLSPQKVRPQKIRLWKLSPQKIRLWKVHLWKVHQQRLSPWNRSSYWHSGKFLKQKLVVRPSNLLAKELPVTTRARKAKDA